MRSTLKTSSILALAIATTLSATSLGSAANIEGPSVFWKISMFGNPRALTSGMEALAAKAAEETDGKFQIKIFYADQLSNSRENLDGLKLNAFEGAGICSFYHPGKNPAWEVFSLPFLPIGDPQVDKYVRMKMFEHPAIMADMEKWNAIPYATGVLPQYEVMGKGKPPLTLADWQGMRVRAGGGLGDAFEQLGAIKTTLPAPETLIAFQNGTVDAAAFPFTYAHVAFKINEEADWYTGNMAPGTSECGFVLNKTAFEALPEAYQNFLMENREMVVDTVLAAYQAADAKNLPMFEANLQKITYTDEQIAEFQEIGGRPVWDKWIADNKDLFDSQAVFDAIFTYAEEAKKLK